MSANRLIQILSLLLEHDRITAPQLAQLLQVSVSTVYREIDALSAAGVPVCTAPGKNGGITLMAGCAPDPTRFTPGEQQQLLAALLTLGMSGGVWWLRQLDRITWVQSLSSGKLFEWNSGLNMEKYLPLIQPLPALFAALAALAAVYLLAAGLTLRENEQSGGE